VYLVWLESSLTEKVNVKHVQQIWFLELNLVLVINVDPDMNPIVLLRDFVSSVILATIQRMELVSSVLWVLFLLLLDLQLAKHALAVMNQMLIEMGVANV